MTPALANEAELYFERGGPAYRLMQRLGIVRGDDPSIRRRIVGFLAITWVPLLVLALIEGRALGPTPRESFLLDFATYARFFLGIPILVLAEVVVGPRLAAAGLQFVRGGLVRPADYPAFDRAIARVAKRRESRFAELVILGLAVAASWWTVAEIAYGGGARTWRSAASDGDSGSAMSYAGFWYRFVAAPVMQFFWYRWLWRLLIWTLFLWTVSRLDLDLVATHADQAGGLGFLGTAHTSLGIFAIALSSVGSAEVAFLLVFEGADVDAFKVPFVVLLAVVQLMFLGPLLIFLPVLARTRLAWMSAYSLLVLQYNRAFHAKWVARTAPTDEPLLGSADIQSLADLGAGFEYVRGMKVVPFSLRVVIQMAVMTSLPCLPLLLLVMPIGKIVDLLAGAVF